nr:MAG TPA: hypothetical protein [Caudoviricetes sp.]
MLLNKPKDDIRSRLKSYYRREYNSAAVLIGFISTIISVFIWNNHMSLPTGSIAVIGTIIFGMVDIPGYVYVDYSINKETKGMISSELETCITNLRWYSDNGKRIVPYHWTAILFLIDMALFSIIVIIGRAI